MPASAHRAHDLAISHRRLLVNLQNAGSCPAKLGVQVVHQTVPDNVANTHIEVRTALLIPLPFDSSRVQKVWPIAPSPPSRAARGAVGGEERGGGKRDERAMAPLFCGSRHLLSFSSVGLASHGSACSGPLP